MPYRLQNPQHYRRQFDGSARLFSACWRWYRRMLAHAIDAPASDADVLGWLDSRAAELVNDSRSPFYMRG